MAARSPSRHDDGDIHIARRRHVSGRNGQIGKLRVVDFDNERALKKEGASLYATGADADDRRPISRSRKARSKARTSQPVVEISHMIEVMRAYQATATLTQSQEDLLRQAIDKLGSNPAS